MRPKLLLAAIFGLVSSSCYSPGDGQAPPLDSIYFPTGIALDNPKAPKYLYVASSDFDLQYRSSSLISYDLDRVQAVLPQLCNQDSDCHSNACDNGGSDPSYFCLSEAGAPPCGALGVHSDADKLLYPGRCKSIDPNVGSLIVDAVGIGAFATDIIVGQNPDYSATAQAGTSYAQRLFLPVRGDATLHWVDWDSEGAKFACGQANTADDSCDDAHRAGNSVFDNSNQLRLPAEPFGVDATADGRYVAVTNQTTGSVSLFSNDWSASAGPRLQYILGGLPSAPVAIAALPGPLQGPTASPGFLVAYSNAAQIDLVRVRSDLVNTPDTAVVDYPRYLLAAAGSAAIGANSLGYDSRGLVIDEAERAAAYGTCQEARGCTNQADSTATRAACNDACAQAAPQPDVYVANRAPSSLLVGGMTPDQAFEAGSSELPSFIDSIALDTGPSRVVLGKVRVAAAEGGGSTFERRVFVVCFDSRRVYVYDPKRHSIEAIIDTGRGPFALVIDDEHSLGYLAHFTDSYLGVISLDQRFPQSYASIIASVGTPQPPRASK